MVQAARNLIICRRGFGFESQIRKTRYKVFIQGKNGNPGEGGREKFK
jgi:hypothetical protein